MEFKKIQNIQIAALGLGTYGLGGEYVPDYSKDQQAIEAIQYAINLGLTHIDTAELYAQGHTEELVGQAIKDFERSQLFITSKVHPSHLRHKDLIKACQDSLKRLETDYLDLYLIHWFNPLIPLEETMRAMDELVKLGLTRFIGVSNFTVDQVKEAQSYTEFKLIADQVLYNLLDREPEEELLPFLQQNEMFLIAFTPLAKGRINKKAHTLLYQIARKYDKTILQVALRYLLHQKNVIAIPKSAQPKHLDEIIGAIGWDLSEEDFQALKHASFS